jgi:small-conductance mechanosensitive channel
MREPWLSYATLAWPLLAALAVGFIARRMLLRWARSRMPDGRRRPWRRVLEVVALPASLAVPLLFLSIAVDSTPLPPGWIPPLRHVLAAGAGACLTWLAVRAIGAVEHRILRKHPVDAADNLAARRIQTRARVLGRVAQSVALLVGIALILMTFPSIRQIGATLLASAGVLGLVGGLAARPVFGNLISGLQIAVTQPIRLDDVVIVQGQWGRVEEILSSYVVVKTWDERRLVVPLQWFIENPFENWTRQAAQLTGPVLLWLDYRTPMDAVRAELRRICESDPRWDTRVCVAQVTNTDRSAIEVRLLVSAANSGDLFDLQCAVRERMVDFLLAHHPEALPRARTSLVRASPQESDDQRMQAAERMDRAVASSTSAPSPEDAAPARTAPPVEPPVQSESRSRPH